jgi:light-regulated signal transduction histidine kinase (bacteriophytochrome)
MKKLSWKAIALTVSIIIVGAIIKQAIIVYITNQQNRTIDQAIQECNKLLPVKSTDTSYQYNAITNYNDCMSKNYGGKLLQQTQNYLTIAKFGLVICFVIILLTPIYYIVALRKKIQQR